MPRPLSFSSDELEQMRREYLETTIAVAELAKRHKLSKRSFYDLIHAHGFGTRKSLAQCRAEQERADLQRADQQRSEQERAAARELPQSQPPEAIAEQLQRMVQRELAAIEKVLAGLPPGNARTARAERAARTLASLTRTLNEVHRLQREQSAPVTADDDDDMPRDIDEFRRELARRIDAFIAGRADAAVPDDAE